MAEFTSFPSIGNVHAFLKEVGANETAPRTLELEGTVKLHGTHADIVARPQTELVWFQSRNRVLSLDNDNIKCCRFFTDRQDAVNALIAHVASHKPDCELIQVCGELCGQNIQKGVALCKLPVMFVIFAIKIDGVWQKLTDFNLDTVGNDVYSIMRAPVYTLSIDTQHPDSAIEEMKRLTDTIEKECPFSATFGHTGGGEGIVWKCKQMQSSRYWFKTKGQSHMVSKVKPAVKSVTVEQQEEQVAVHTFVGEALLEPRLQQGLDYLREMNLAPEMKNISVFMRWIVDDVKKEESDALQHLPVSKVQKEIGQRAKEWYVKHC
jgi:hypothetical protein